MYSISSAIVTVLLPPYHFGCLFFLSLVWLLWLWCPILLSIKVVRVDMLVSLILEKKFSVFHLLSMRFALSYLYRAFISVSPEPTLVRLCIMNGCSILPDAFSASVEMIIRFLSFLLLMWCITLIVDIEPPLYPRNKSHLTTMNDPFHILLNLFCSFLIGEFCIYSSKILTYDFSFFFVSLVLVLG